MVTLTVVVAAAVAVVVTVAGVTRGEAHKGSIRVSYSVLNVSRL